ncbi:hypothetical protein LP414_26310 [Polaromonas sp. P1(28)-13]|nr:hypothetical protein LP414_26310 [Polaromonas sp. P1(28)-13]
MHKKSFGRFERMPLYAADGCLNNAEFVTGHDRVLCLRLWPWGGAGRLGKP